MPNPKSKPIRGARGRKSRATDERELTTAEIDAWHAAQRAAVKSRVEHDKRVSVRRRLLDDPRR